MKKIVLIYLIVLSFVNPVNAQTIQKTKDYIDSFSTTSCFLLAKKDTSILWTATGFFIRANSKIYLITNNHVVGGEFYIDEYQKNNNHQSPSPNKLPDTIIVRLYSKVLYGTSFKKIPIIIKDEQHWIKFWDNENAQTGLMDIVAIPISDTFGLNSCTILSNNNLLPDLELYPSSELYVVGFPLDLALQSVYPIWKRATIASDPKLNLMGNSFFLIDGTPKAGMSGSPIFYRGISYTTYGHSYTAGGLSTFLVGIFNSYYPSYELGGAFRLEKVFEKLSTIK